MLVNLQYVVAGSSHSTLCIPVTTLVTRGVERMTTEHTHHRWQAQLSSINTIMAIMKPFLLMSALVGHVLATFSLLGFTFNGIDIEPRSHTASDISIAPQTIFLPWTKAFSRASDYTPSVRGSISGKSFTFPIDTGGTGVLIGAPLLPNVKLTSKNTLGWEYDESNSMLYNGRFVSFNITFNGAESGEQVISRVPVLVVTKVSKCPGYDVTTDNGLCPKAKLVGTGNPAKVTYMGVGFGRNVQGSGIPYGTASHNPFLNVISHSGFQTLSMKTGYIISTRGVYLGLTANNTAQARWVKLEQMISKDSRAWAPPLLSFVFNNLTKPIQAQALIDTSVTQMYIQSSPGHPLPNVTIRDTKATLPAVRRVQPGTKLSFAFPDFNAGVAGYELVVGDMQFPSQPSYVQPLTSGKTPFVNTGRNFLYGFTIVFDAVAGRFGLICELCK
jgi:hypothetical protein